MSETPQKRLATVIDEVHIQSLLLSCKEVPCLHLKTFRLRHNLHNCPFIWRLSLSRCISNRKPRQPEIPSGCPPNKEQT